MKKHVYQVLSTVFGAVLILVGIGAFLGGQYAHNYVTSQLSQEKITMPGEGALKSLDEASQKALRPFVEQQMTTGEQAQAYANHFIWEHMQSACQSVKDANGKEVAPIPADKCTYSGIGGAVTEAKNSGDTAAVAAYSALRTSNFQGDALRSMLLTAYAFWLVGTIAIWAGIGALVLGVVLLVLRFTAFKDTAKPVAAHAAAETATP